MAEYYGVPDSDKKNVLLYSPGLNGHPQVYCRVIGDIVLENRGQVFILTENTEDISANWPSLWPYPDDERVHFISTRDEFGCEDGQLNAEQVLAVQESKSIDSTVFIWPEYFRDEFIRIAKGEAPRLLGKNVGIYGETTLWYPGEEYYSGKMMSFFGPTLGDAFRRITDRIYRPWTDDTYFFTQILIKNRLLQTVLVRDERLALRYPDLVTWMPDIYKVFTGNDRSEQSVEEYELHKSNIEKFFEGVDPENIILYFGEGAWYKGYDIFLKLLSISSETFGIHAGKKRYGEKVESIRVHLKASNRLYEIGRYIKNQDTIDFVFKCTQRFVSTHRLTQSSGTVLQALDYGLPVLVPESGLLGFRVKENGLGMTYQYGDVEDLKVQWDVFRQRPVEDFQRAIEKFMEKFSQDEVSGLFVKELL